MKQLVAVIRVFTYSSNFGKWFAKSVGRFCNRIRIPDRKPVVDVSTMECVFQFGGRLGRRWEHLSVCFLGNRFQFGIERGGMPPPSQYRTRCNCGLAGSSPAVASNPLPPLCTKVLRCPAGSSAPPLTNTRLGFSLEVSLQRGAF